jgi:dynein heavy chain
VCARVCRIKWHESWLHDSFLLLDAEMIEKNHGVAQKNMHRCVRAFEKLEMDGCTQIALKIRQQVEDFKPHIPLISALRNPGMRERHWKELASMIGIEIALNDTFTLTKVFALGLGRHIEVISKVGEKAGKEYQIEQALDKMSSEWENVNLFIDAYRETGTFILKGVDDLQTLLDEHVTMTQAMQFSAFKKPFEERIDSWAETLSTVSDVLEEWIKVQRSWLYLQPIFDSSDIQRQLPTEYKRFSTVDKNWRQTLQAAKSHPKAIKFCANDKLLEKFQESNKFLDLVQKGLSDYLETKRAAFARFYFLSNDELLEILSQTKDPSRVQPHLKKCFEGIRSVGFGDNLIILSMISAEGEVSGVACRRSAACSCVCRSACCACVWLS